MEPMSDAIDMKTKMGIFVMVVLGFGKHGWLKKESNISYRSSPISENSTIWHTVED